MTSLGRRFCLGRLGLAFVAGPRGPCGGGAYEARLPDGTGHRAARPVRLVPCKEVFPGATHFFLKRKGQPPYVEGHDQASS